MSGDRWQRLQELFEAAAELPAAEREPYLDDACGEDASLKREVLALLEAADSGEVEAALHDAAAGALEASSSPGEHVGPYRLLRELGSGGMGTVFFAERADGEFEQQVAIKLVRGGARGGHIVERFRSEMRMLARLEHPNIARLIDGGSTASGVPYFVMEYVDGEPIDRYCDRLRLSTRARLELFGLVCDAVESAHRRLIVHRDLKPSNILVTEEGTPKLLDFGIAKLLEEEGRSGDEPLTRVGDRAMTPEYASPEQVRAQPVSTATDVYTLGLLLYELLTGRRAHRLSSYTPSEVERVVCDEAPQRPSTVVGDERPAVSESSTPPTPEEISEARATEPWKLKKRLAGELDNIVMTALRKEPERRYPSVAELAADVRRHLAGRPVRAHADTLRYRLRKFVVRNRAAVLVALAALLAAVALTTFYTLRLARERDLARQESAKARQVAEFLRSVFTSSDPNRRRGEEILARDLLDRGAAEIRADSSLQPETRGELLGLLGEIHGKLGLYDRALELLEEAQVEAHAAHGARSSQAATIAFHEGLVLRDKGAPVEARDRLREALEIRTEVFGEESAPSAEVLSVLGMAEVEQGGVEEGDRLIRRAVEILAADASADRSQLATAVHYLGNLAWGRGDFAGAEAEYRRALRVREEHLGPEHTEVGDSLQSIAVALMLQERQEDALPFYARALEIYERRLGGEHPRVAGVIEGLASAHVQAGRLDDAEAAIRRSLAIHRAASGDDGLNASIAKAQLGRVLTLQGRSQQAVELGREAVASIAARDSPRSLAWAELTLAESYMAAGRLDEAAAGFGRSLHLRQEALSPDHPSLAEPLLGLGWARGEQGRDAEAIEHLERAIALYEAHDDESSNLTEARALLGTVLARGGSCERAIELLERSLPELRAAGGGDAADLPAAEAARASCGG